MDYGKLKKNFEDHRFLTSYFETREEAAAYLKGQTFSAEGEKGWYLICVDEFALGWGKVSNGTLKNKYPSGWRLV